MSSNTKKGTNKKSEKTKFVFVNSISNSQLEKLIKRNYADNEMLVNIAAIENIGKETINKINFLFDKLMPMFSKYLKLQRALEQTLKENELLKKVNQDLQKQLDVKL